MHNVNQFTQAPKCLVFRNKNMRSSSTANKQNNILLNIIFPICSFKHWRWSTNHEQTMITLYSYHVS